MDGIKGNLGTFDEHGEPWSVYPELLDSLITGNDIPYSAVVPKFLSVMGPKTFNLFCDLLQPTKPGTKTYREIVDVLTKHYSPKPLLITERFRFH